MRRSIDPRSLLATVALGAGALAYLYFGFLPGKREIAEVRYEALEKQDYVLRIERLAAATAPLENELREARQYVEQTRGSTPDEGDLSALMFALSDEAERAGVTLLRVDPEDREPLATLAKAPLSISCQGGFSELHAFFVALERAPFVLWTDSLVLNPAMPDSPVLLCEWKVTAFVSTVNEAAQQQPNNAP
jgi:Tfp pilus assembly protein PilO